MEGIELTPIFVPEHEQYVRVRKMDKADGCRRNLNEIYIPYQMLQKIDAEFGDKVQILEDRTGNIYIKKSEEGILITGEKKKKTRKINSSTIANKLLGSERKTARYLCEIVKINGDNLISICTKVNRNKK